MDEDHDVIPDLGADRPDFAVEHTFDVPGLDTTPAPKGWLSNLGWALNHEVLLWVVLGIGVAGLVAAMWWYDNRVQSEGRVFAGLSFAWMAVTLIVFGFGVTMPDRYSEDEVDLIEAAAQDNLDRGDVVVTTKDVPSRQAVGFLSSGSVLCHVDRADSDRSAVTIKCLHD